MKFACPESQKRVFLKCGNMASGSSVAAGSEGSSTAGGAESVDAGTVGWAEVSRGVARFCETGVGAGLGAVCAAVTRPRKAKTQARRTRGRRGKAGRAQGRPRTILKMNFIFIPLPAA